jgi:hypothetical protein
MRMIGFDELLRPLHDKIESSGEGPLAFQQLKVYPVQQPQFFLTQQEFRPQFPDKAFPTLHKLSTPTGAGPL